MKISLLKIVIISCATLLILKTSDMIYNHQLSIGDIITEPLIAQEENKEAETEAETETNVEKENINIDADDKQFSDNEIDILRRLAKRREELEKWARNLEIKENVLNITQTKIDQKIKELRELKEEVENSLANYNKKEDEKIGSLVRIYQNMKPKAAAKIFAEIDLETLLEIVDNMKEANVAVILAQMNPKLAKDLTEKFAERNKIRKKEARN